MQRKDDPYQGSRQKSGQSWVLLPTDTLVRPQDVQQISPTLSVKESLFQAITTGREEGIPKLVQSVTNF